MKPLCFVLMPFGRKPGDGGRMIDFDVVYRQVIRPAIEDAGLEPIRADEESAGGIIHKPMFERLMLCDYAVADLTTANPNVLYELGIRHGVRPHSTVLIFGLGTRLPFDVAPLRGLPYSLDAAGAPQQVAQDRRALAERLESCRNPQEDSPLFQLVQDWPRPDLAHLHTELFRERVEYSRDVKERLRQARSAGEAAVREVEAGIAIADTDPAIAVDLLLSYRAVKAYPAMIALVGRLPQELAQSTLVREQLGFALNRAKRHRDAEQVLRELIAERGASSQTNGLLGRVYKDLWEEAADAGRAVEARGLLRQAIQTYLDGFNADWRDAYPGINAVTLMEQQDPVDPRQAELLPVVRYAAKRRLDAKVPDYWDHATLVELAVLAGDSDTAQDALAAAVAVAIEPWWPETTARNLCLIREARARRGQDAAWIAALEQELGRKARALAPPRA